MIKERINNWLSGTHEASARDESGLSLAEAKRADDMLSILGASGNQFQRGKLTNTEHVAKLKGKEAAKEYAKMRRDAQVQATESIVALPILGADWVVRAIKKGKDGAITELPEVTEFVHNNLFVRNDFSSLLRHLLLCWPFGFEVMEKVHERIDGRTYYEGFYHLGQATIQKWHTERSRLTGIQQRTWKDGTYKDIDIPKVPGIDLAHFKLIHIALNQEGDNYEGHSGLRAAWGPWSWKQQLVNLALIAIERFAAGIPKAKIKGSWTSTIASVTKSILRRLKTGEQAYLLETDEVEFSILGHQSNARLDPKAMIDYCDESIAMSALAMALKLGSTQTGSRALGDTMFKMFLLSIESLANLIRETINKQIIEPLLELNFAEWQEMEVTVEWSNLKPEDSTVMADALQKLTTWVTYDEESENHIRKTLGLPPLPEDKDGNRAKERANKAEDKTLSDATRIFIAHIKEKMELAVSEAAKNQDPTKLNTKHVCDDSCDHGTGGKKTLAAKRDFWRELTDLEKHVSLREIDGHQDDAQEQIVDYIRNDRKVWAKSLRDQIAEAIESGKVSNLGKVVVPNDLRKEAEKEIVSVQRDIFRYGRRTVQDELRKQTKAAKKASGVPYDDSAVTFRDDPHEAEEITDIFKHRAGMYIESLTSKAKQLAIGQATNLMRSKGKDVTDEDLDAIEQFIVETFDATSRRESAVVVTEAFNGGRDNEAQKVGVVRALYSAILDQNTCEACSSEDGQEYEIGTSEYYAVSPPNPNCESTASGDNYCRCLWVYEYEVAA
jgi:hypothetical protein